MAGTAILLQSRSFLRKVLCATYPVPRDVATVNQRSGRGLHGIHRRELADLLATSWWKAQPGRQLSILGRESPFRNQRPPDRDRGGTIHVERTDRRPPHRREADDPRTPPPKMLGPYLFSRMVQRHDLLADRVNTGDVGPLVEVAPQAGHGQIIQLRLAAVEPGGDVVDGEGEVERRLGQPALLAGIPGSCPDPSLNRRTHAG